MFVGPITIGSVLLYIAVSIAVGVIAGRAGRRGFGWFVLAVFITPLFAGILLIASLQVQILNVRTDAKVDSAVGSGTQKTVVCPSCHRETEATFGGSFLVGGATTCKHCGYRITNNDL